MWHFQSSVTVSHISRPLHRTSLFVQAAGCHRFQQPKLGRAHYNFICLKANKRLHFLKLLKRSRMSSEDLLQYYKSVIRPVIEYACPLWQSGLTNLQRNQLEAIKKRALRIIYGYDCQMDYQCQCAVYHINTVIFRLDM